MASVASLPRPCLITSREVNEARRPHTCSRPCAFEEKKTGKKRRNPAAPTTHHEIHSSPATATTSRRRSTKRVPPVSPYSPTSIDPGFVEVGLVQLSQSVKNTNVTHVGGPRTGAMAPKNHQHPRQQSRPQHAQSELDEEDACTRRLEPEYVIDVRVVENVIAS